MPSRSKKTASAIPGRAHEVIDVGVAAEGIDLAERVVLHPDDLFDVQPGFTHVAGEFGRFDELGVLVSAPRQEVEDVFRADHGHQIGLEVAV